MPVTKFKSVSDMPRPGRIEGSDLIDRIRTLWNRAFALSPPDFPRGVRRFATIEEANDARSELVTARMRRTVSPASRKPEG